MLIQFDPSNPQDVEKVRHIIGEHQGVIDYGEAFGRKQFEPGNGVSSAETSQQTTQNGMASVDPASQDFDSAGIPWDSRIHSEKKGQNKDGTWRNKRGVDKDYIKQITDELRAEHCSVSNATVPPKPESDEQTQQAAPPSPPSPPVAEQTQQAAPPSPPSPPVAEQTQQAATAEVTFPQFMQKVVAYMQQTSMTMSDVNETLNSTMGIKAAAMLANDTARIPEAMANLGIQ